MYLLDHPPSAISLVNCGGHAIGAPLVAWVGPRGEVSGRSGGDVSITVLICGASGPWH